MKLHGGKLREGSRNLSFFLENSSTTPLMKKIGSVKGVMLLAVRLEAVAPIFSHALGVLPALCFLGNAFCQWGKSVTISKQGKTVRGYFLLSFL